ncbi:MAG TPA: anthranilate synthase component I [Trueperaceae bacterium]
MRGSGAAVAETPARGPLTRAVYREVLADLETPLTAYLKVAGHPSFLLESVEQGERVARYSFIGTGERRRVSARGHEVTVTAGGDTTTFTAEDPLRALWDAVVRYTVAEPGLPPLWAGAVGYASYDLVRAYESLPDANPDELGVPDLLFVEPELVVVFDHLKRKIMIVAPAAVGDAADEARAEALVEAAYARLRGPLPGVPGDRAGRSAEFTTNMDQAAFEAAVARAVEYIRAGDVFQVVPSLRQSADLGVHPFAVYRALRTVNPSPYLGYLDLGPVTLVSSSPESLVRAKGRHVETLPIAGTRWRGQTPEEDEALARELLADEKERAEHVMLVDLGRNDLGRVCEYGSVRVPQFMAIERYSHVMHLTSIVEGRLAEGTDRLDALVSCFPAGTVSGAPKVRAMEIIAELEPTRRGIYAGAVGYLDFAGNLDFCIAIRTIVILGGKAYLQAGAGIVADSNPSAEYEETRDKARALVRALELAHREL